MHQQLKLLDSFKAHGNDGRTYTIKGYEFVAQVDGMPASWQSTGVAEYRLDDGRRLDELRPGHFAVPGAALQLDRVPG